MSPSQILRPSQLIELVQAMLDANFPLVTVEGEISNLARPASGHVYFTLKDAQAQIRCAMFRPRTLGMRVRPADGMQVLLRARVSLYPARGEFQLVVEQLEAAGQGALQRAFEERKTRLAAEGLFAAARKRPLPLFPRRVGLLTSPTGAAVRDVLAVLARRFPLAALDLLPIPVQGETAAGQIVAMIERALRSQRYDVLLLTRGGGSLEDLWAFNDEALARTIAGSAVPVLAAIGHEIDFTLAELAADLRASTPSAAAELLYPDAAQLSLRIERLQQSALRFEQRRRHDRAQRVDTAVARLRAARPQQRLALWSSRADDLGRRLARVLSHRIVLLRQRHASTLRALSRARLEQRIADGRERNARALRALRRAVLQRSAVAQAQLGELARALDAVSPLATLGRGYCVLRDPHDGRLIRSVHDTAPGAALDAALSDGHLQLRVEKPVGD